MSYFIKEILKNFNVTGYLTSKGIGPVRESQGRKQYRCPMPAHNDSDPSFFVYEKDGVEKYKCFGCSIGGNVIDLYCDLENTSIRNAISYFANRLDINEEDIITSILEEVSEDDMSFNINDLAIKVSRSCYNYLNEVDFDKEEVIVIEKALEKIDSVIHRMDIKTLEEMYDILTVYGIPNRMKKFMQNKEKELSSGN